MQGGFLHTPRHFSALYRHLAHVQQRYWHRHRVTSDPLGAAQILHIHKLGLSEAVPQALAA